MFSPSIETCMTSIPSPTKPGSPVWQLAELYPDQGDWSEADYLSLDAGRLIELRDGMLEFPPMPTEMHQLLALFLYRRLADHAERTGSGLAMAAPFRVRVRPQRFREPDVMLLQKSNDPRRRKTHWDGADLVIEVVSEDDPDRD